MEADSWNDWWNKKKINNDEFLKQVNIGNLELVKKYLSSEDMQGNQADVNTRGLDQWTALHFASKSGHFDIV